MNLFVACILSHFDGNEASPWLYQLAWLQTLQPRLTNAVSSEAELRSVAGAFVEFLLMVHANVVAFEECLRIVTRYSFA